MLHGHVADTSPSQQQRLLEHAPAQQGPSGYADRAQRGSSYDRRRW
jgi:hypothetical protein